MSFSFELFLAFSYLRSRYSNFSILHILSLIAMMLSVATLISVMSVMNGFRVELVQSIVGLDGHVEVDLFDKDQYSSVVDNISSMKGVNAVFPMTEDHAMIKHNGFSAGVIVRGFEQSDLENRFKLSHFKMFSGTLGDFKDGIFLGSRLASKMGIKLGDSVKIVSANGFDTLIGSLPRISTHKVVGTFEVGMFEYDEILAIFPISTAQSVFGYKNSSIRKIQIFVNDPFYSRIISGNLKKTFFAVSDWQERQSYLLDALSIEKSAMFFILSMIILIASFGIVSGVICVIESKRSAIAVMRTLGMTKAAVTRVFSLCGLIVGFCGVFLGCGIGILFSLNIGAIKDFLENNFGFNIFNRIVYFLSSLPSELLMSDVVEVVLISLGLCLIAVVVPSWRAACIEPSVILRSE